MKKPKLFLACGTLLALTLVAISCGNIGKLYKNVKAETCGHVGYHYEALDPTKTTSGHKEFWACCKCHQAFLEQPEGTFTTQDDSLMSGGLNSDHIAYLSPTGDLPSHLKILYQGDSITDAGRNWEDATDLGNGYARMVSEQLENIYGQDIDFDFVNYAHYGWRLMDNWNEGGVDHYQEQFYQFNADIATIFIGFNDIMAGKSEGQEKYVSDKTFEDAYDNLLSGLKSRGTYAICIGPYYVIDDIDSPEYFAVEFTNKRNIVKKVAEKYDFSYIDIKPSMDAALAKGAEKMELFGDLIHPFAAGNEIIGDLVLDAIRDHFDSSYVSPTNVGQYNPIVGHNDNSDDLTNKRLFGYGTYDGVRYDNSVYYTRKDFESSESVKLLNNTLTKSNSHGVWAEKTGASFVFTPGADLYEKQIEFDVKTDNAMPQVSLLAHSSVRAKSYDVTSELVVKFSDQYKVEPLNNGWYHVKINIEDWMKQSKTNETILKNVRQLVVLMSRGEDEATRKLYNIDKTKPSVAWIDNLRFEDAEAPSTIETATKTRNWELMSIDEGWCNGTKAEVTNTEVYGSSIAARKFTFKDSLDHYKHAFTGNTDSDQRAYIAFSPETEWGDPTGIDVKDAIVSFDFKLSQEFFDSTNTYKHMMTIQFVDEGWDHAPDIWSDWVPSGKYNFDMDHTDNGWMHFEKDLTQIDAVKVLNDNLIRIRIGIFGLNETTKKTASLVIDNFQIYHKSN